MKKLQLPIKDFTNGYGIKETFQWRMHGDVVSMDVATAMSSEFTLASKFVLYENFLVHPRQVNYKILNNTIFVRAQDVLYWAVVAGEYSLLQGIWLKLFYKLYVVSDMLEMAKGYTLELTHIDSIKIKDYADTGDMAVNNTVIFANRLLWLSQNLSDLWQGV